MSAVDLLIFFDTKISTPSDSVLDGVEFLGVRILLVVVFGIGGRWSLFLVKKYPDYWEPGGWVDKTWVVHKLVEE